MNMKSPITKKELSKKYLVSYSTFIKWLQSIPELNLSVNQRILTPKQINIIYENIGEPPSQD